MGLAEIFGAKPQAAPVQQHRGLFGDGHAGDILGGLAKILAYGPFAGIANHNIHRREDRQDAQDAQEAQIRQAQLAAVTAKQNRNQILQGPGGAVFAVDPDTNQINVLRQPDPVDQKSALQKQIEYIKTLPTGSPERALAERALPGYGYTEPVMQRQLAGRLAVHGAPTYASTHRASAAPKPPAGFILD